MLGVRRTSVTLAARMLQQVGMIKYARGNVHILDVEALRESACECYEAVKHYYSDMVGRDLHGADKTLGD